MALLIFAKLTIALVHVKVEPPQEHTPHAGAMSGATRCTASRRPFTKAQEPTKKCKSI